MDDSLFQKTTLQENKEKCHVSEVLKQLLFHAETVPEILSSVTLAGNIYINKTVKGSQFPLFTCDFKLKIFVSPPFSSWSPPPQQVSGSSVSLWHMYCRV